MTARKLTAAQKAVIAKNAAANVAKPEAIKLSDDAVKAMATDTTGLTNVYDENKPFLKVRNNLGVRFIQNGCIFDCTGKPLELMKE